MLRLWILITSLCLVVYCQTDQPYDLVLVAKSGINTLHLLCREDGLDVPNAFYWLNGTSLFDHDRTLFPGLFQPSTGGVSFTITRDTEGIYTCGIVRDSINRIQSRDHYLAAFPEPLPNVAPNTVVPAATGSVARLKCAIQPGRLVGLYIAIWYNGTDEIVDFRSGMTSNNVDRERYSVDPGDLSLLITDVTPEDAGLYRCVLGVRVPDRADAAMFYEQSGNVNITVVVFEPPSIQQPPQPQVVPLPSYTPDSQGAGTTFTCTATASTDFASSLEILWFHNGEDVSRSEEADKYTFEETNRESMDGGVTSVSHRLQINYVGVFDSGFVTCEARLPPSAVTGGLPATAQKETTLTVLGGFQSMNPVITQDGNVLYDLRLHVTVPTEVQLYVEYTPVNGQAMEPALVRAVFSDTDTILHLEREPPQSVRNTGFTVRVALATPQLSQRGPFSAQSQVLDIRDTPLSAEQINTIIIAVSASFGAFVLLTFIVIILIVVLMKKYCTRNVTLGHAERQTDKVEKPKGLSPKEEVEWRLETFKTFYNGLKKCDGPRQEIEAEITPVPQEYEILDDQVKDAVEDLIAIVRGGLTHSKLKEKFHKELVQMFYRIVDKDSQFLIRMFKDVYIELYEDITGTLNMQQNPRKLDELAVFAEESLQGLIKKNPKYRERFEAALSHQTTGL